MTVLPEGKDWVDALAALAVPTIALVGLVIGVLNHGLAMQRRNDDLFDRRYDLLREITDFQRRASSLTNQDELYRAQEDILLRASFLFDGRFGEQVRAILDDTRDFAPFDVDPRVIALFRRRMRGWTS